jgi:hypothetical protein
MGVWWIGFVATLTLYALNEILSAYLAIPIDTMNIILGSIAIAVPVIAATPTYLILRQNLAKMKP